MQVSNAEGAEAAFEILAKNRHEEGSLSFWGHEDECDDSLAVRSTALALMVYIERGEFMTEPIVRWLNGKRTSSSGWGSTVDTLLATEALVMWSAKYGQDYSGSGVALEVEAKGGRRAIVVVGGQSLQDDFASFISLEDASKSVSVEAKGNGLALVQLTSRYTTTSLDELANQENHISAFDLEPRIDFDYTYHSASQQNITQIRVLSCQR